MNDEEKLGIGILGILGGAGLIYFLSKKNASNVSKTTSVSTTTTTVSTTNKTTTTSTTTTKINPNSAATLQNSGNNNLIAGQTTTNKTTVTNILNNIPITQSTSTPTLNITPTVINGPNNTLTITATGLPPNTQVFLTGNFCPNYTNPPPILSNTYTTDSTGSVTFTINTQDIWGRMSGVGFYYLALAYNTSNNINTPNYVTTNSIKITAVYQGTLTVSQATIGTGSTVTFNVSGLTPNGSYQLAIMQPVCFGAIPNEYLTRPHGLNSNGSAQLNYYVAGGSPLWQFISTGGTYYIQAIDNNGNRTNPVAITPA